MWGENIFVEFHLKKKLNYISFKIAHPRSSTNKHLIMILYSPISPQMTLMSFCLCCIWTLPSEITTFKTTFVPAFLTKMYSLLFYSSWPFTCVITLWTWSPRSLRDCNQVTAWELTWVCYVLEITTTLGFKLSSPHHGRCAIRLPSQGFNSVSKVLSILALISNIVSMLYAQEKKKNKNTTALCPVLDLDFSTSGKVWCQRQREPFRSTAFFFHLTHAAWLICQNYNTFKEAFWTWILIQILHVAAKFPKGKTLVTVIESVFVLYHRRNDEMGFVWII